MTEVKSALLVPLFLSFSFSRVLNCFCYMLLKNLDRTMCGTCINDLPLYSLRHGFFVHRNADYFELE